MHFLVTCANVSFQKGIFSIDLLGTKRSIM